MMKSVSAVLLGILLALGIGALEIFGIVAPVFTRFLSPELASTALPAIILVFAAAFAFYFGGMFASYRAPARRRLHGVMDDPFTNLRTPGGLLFTGVIFVVVLAASYIGGRRGETLYAYNQAFIRRQQRRRQRTEEGS
jgi:hypothetical protein